MGSNKSRRMIGAGLESLGGSLMDIYETRQRDKRSSNRQKAIDARQKRGFDRADANRAEDKEATTKWRESEIERRKKEKAGDRAYKEGRETPTPWKLWYKEEGKPGLESGKFKSPSDMVNAWNAASGKETPAKKEERAINKENRKGKKDKEKLQERREFKAIESGRKEKETVSQINARFQSAHKGPVKNGVAAIIPTTPEELKRINEDLRPQGYEMLQKGDGRFFPAKTTTTAPPHANMDEPKAAQTGAESSSTGTVPQGGTFNDADVQTTLRNHPDKFKTAQDVIIFMEENKGMTYANR